ncbi:LacI family DNA-binding transcriptional regulator [Gryllotalpicola daejeonensis]|uniref:LacI family DNA-binding transcriptional regulator n=1 Tax=Gryllotalpicola daejeonensis TaxID=993087 RepID=A0ABP7ZHH9_9MICO
MASVNVKDVARLAGVSIGTVSNVLNHPTKVSAETAVRVHDAIDKLGFVRNDAARQLRAGSSRALGLVILDARNPFFTELSRGAEDEAARAGLSVIIGNSDEASEREAAYLDLFEQQRLRGLLISPVGDVGPRLRRLRERGIRSVLVDRYSQDTSFSSVSVDDVAGGAMAVRHLIETGRRRIAFVGGSLAIRQVSDRLAGARAAVAERADATLESIEVSALTVHEGVAAARRLIDRPRGKRPDAVFAANDLLAIGLLQAFAASGEVSVPGDIALIGYDDIDFASASVVPLSSVRQPAALIGETAVRLMLAEAEDPTAKPQAVEYQPELVIRASSAG